MTLAKNNLATGEQVAESVVLFFAINQLKEPRSGG
jgi:hypothetical protein